MAETENVSRPLALQTTERVEADTSILPWAHDAEPGMLCAWLTGATMLIAALAYNYVLFARFGAFAAEQFGYIDAIILAAAFLAALLAVTRLKTALFALPFALPLMNGPDIPHLPFFPFFREFGVIVIVVIILKAAWELRRQPLAEITRAGHQTWQFTSVRVLSLYVAVSVVPLAFMLWRDQLFKFKVSLSHLIFEGLLAALVVAVLLAIQYGGLQTFRRLLDGLYAVAALVVGYGLVALTYPFIFDSNFGLRDDVSVYFFGAYYYCRMKLTFFGPDHFSAFLCMSLPLFVHYAATDTEKWRRRVSLACIAATPILMVAGSSRSMRVAMILVFVALAACKEYRSLAIKAGIFAVILVAATLPFRCTIDIAAVLTTTDPTINGGIIPLKDFLTDQSRLAHFQNIWAFLAYPPASTPAASVQGSSVSSAASGMLYVARMLFGNGAGLAAYEVFGLGAHMTYLDVFIEKGILGAIAFFALFAFALRAIGKSWTMRSRYDQLRAYILIVMLVPIMLAAATFDVRLWVFPWFTIALVLAEAELFPYGARHRDSAARPAKGEARTAATRAGVALPTSAGKSQ